MPHKTNAEKQKSRRPYRAALAVLAAALAVYAALAAFRLAGWPRGQFAFTAASGSESAWQGFTLYTAVESGRSPFALRLAARLQDGVLATRSVPPQSAQSGYSYAGVREFLTVPAADHQALDAAAAKTEISSTSGAFFLQRRFYGHAYLTETDRVQVMEEVTFQENGRVIGSVRLDLGTVKLLEPVMFYAELYEDAAPRRMDSDYSLNIDNGLPQSWPGETEEAYRLQFLPAEDAALIAFDPLPGSPLSCGVYRVTELLTEAEVAALPADTAVDGAPMTALSTPYGSVELICPLAAGETVCRLLPVEGGHALLTRLTTGAFRLYLFDGGWQLQSEQTLPIRQDPAASYMMPERLRGDELVLQLQNEQDPEAPGDTWVLRVSGGQLAESVCLPGAALPAADDTGGPWLAAAGLNADATALLIVQTACHTETARLPGAGQPLPASALVEDGYLLRVWQGGVCTATGTLAANVQANWRGNVWGGSRQLNLSLPAPGETAALRRYFE